jgi:hypothetical protein
MHCKITPPIKKAIFSRGRQAMPQFVLRSMKNRTTEIYNSQRRYIV